MIKLIFQLNCNYIYRLSKKIRNQCLQQMTIFLLFLFSMTYANPDLADLIKILDRYNLNSDYSNFWNKRALSDAVCMKFYSNPNRLWEYLNDACKVRYFINEKVRKLSLRNVNLIMIYAKWYFVWTDEYRFVKFT